MTATEKALGRAVKKETQKDRYNMNGVSIDGEEGRKRYIWRKMSSLVRSECEREIQMIVYSWQPVTVSKVSPVTVLVCCHTLLACPERACARKHTHTYTHTSCILRETITIVMNKAF